MKILIPLLILISSLTSVAQSLSTRIHNNYSSLRALGMGNAFTAVADDYSLIFYNPAGFARKPYNEVQISLLGAGVSSKTLTIAKDIKEAADTPGTDNDKAQAISNVLDRYYGETLGAKVQALELFWVRKNWGIALLPLDLTVDMSVNRQVGPTLDLNIKGDTTIAFGYGRDITKDIDAGITVKYLHRVAVEQSVSALELATNPNVLSEDRFKEGTTFDFDLGFMWTPPVLGKKIVKKTELKKAEAPNQEATKNSQEKSAPAQPEANQEAPKPVPLEDQPNLIKEDDLKDKTTEPASDSNAVPNPENPATRTPQQTPEEQSDVAAGFEPSPEKKNESDSANTTNDASEKVDQDKKENTTAEQSPNKIEKTEPVLETTPSPVQIEKVEAPKLKEEEIVTTEAVTDETQMSYPLSLGLVMHNVLESNFTLSKLANKNATEVPNKLERVIDVGAQYKIVNGEDFKIRLMVDAKNIMHPEITFNKAFHAGLEFDYSPSGWFRTQLRGGINQMYYTAGATLLLGFINIDAVSYGEEVGTPSDKKENRVYAAKVGFNF